MLQFVLFGECFAWKWPIPPIPHLAAKSWVVSLIFACGACSKHKYQVDNFTLEFEHDFALFQNDKSSFGQAAKSRKTPQGGIKSII